jgi:hypothetical protein
MADTKTIIEQASSVFNKRDIDRALAPMTQDGSWPKASEGGKDIDPNWLPSVERESRNQPRESRTGCRPHP